MLRQGVSQGVFGCDWTHRKGKRSRDCLRLAVAWQPPLFATEDLPHQNPVTTLLPCWFTEMVSCLSWANSDSFDFENSNSCPLVSPG